MIKSRETIHLLLTHYNYRSMVEIGVQDGLFSKHILSLWGGHLTLIDAWQQLDKYKDISNIDDAQHNICYENTLRNIEPYKDRCRVIKGLSSVVCNDFPNRIFDIVYIDANHSYDAVYQDISLWVNKVKSGGCISGHDYLDGELPEGSFGVKSAVKDFFGREPDIITVEDKWPSWFVFIK